MLGVQLPLLLAVHMGLFVFVFLKSTEGNISTIVGGVSFNISTI